MATFSLGTSGVTPEAPGVYINEQAGKLANADLAGFDTVYMLVETEEDVSVTEFPYNTPIPITSLSEYKELIKVGNSTVPEERIPLLSYNCVNEFFENSQVGDLRVVRVGTPNEIAEIEFLPSGTKINSSDLPSGLMAGDTVYVQMTINGQKLVAGKGSTGYTSGGEWLGVPVEIPVSYVSGDEANNRKISAAFVAAVVAAIESNPSISTSVYVRSAGLINDLDTASNSENGYVTIAASTFNGSVNVVTQVLPVGSNYVLMQNGYSVSNIVGKSTDLVRTPQDYTQCIATAFDGQQDQGYLITPTAYAQFNAAGRAAVGAAAAAHCESNNFKWMALADPGPFLVTDINEYSSYKPHAAAANLATGLKYLIDNVIYEWTGLDVTYDRLTTQDIIFGQSAQTAVNESANLVAANTKVGLLDEASYTVAAVPTAANGLFSLNTANWWPVTLPIQKVTLTTGNVGNDFNAVSIQGKTGTFNLNGTEVYVVAAPYNTLTDSEYSLNNVFLATTAADASAIYEAVNLVNGSSFITAAPNGAVFMAAPTGDTATLAYADPHWDIPVAINGQTSDLIDNISGDAAGVNTLHLPGTLQDATDTYRLLWNSRTILDANVSVTTYAGAETDFSGAAAFSVSGHGLRSGQKVSFTQPVVVFDGATTRNLVEQTTKLTSHDYWVKVVDANSFVLANSLNNYTVGAYLSIPAGYTVQAYPTILYTRVLGGGLTSTTPGELLTLPMIRGRKYEFDTSSIFEEAAVATAAPTPSTTAPQASIYLNNSSLVLGEDQITPYGEDLTSGTKCDWLPKFNLVAPTLTPSALTTNAYCVPTVDQFFSANAYFVPAIDPILGGDWDAAAADAAGPVTSFEPALTGGAGGTVGFAVTPQVSSSGAGTGAQVSAQVTTIGAIGPIATGSVTSAGSGGVAGVYTSVPLTGGVGSGAVADITVVANPTGPISVLGALVPGSLGITSSTASFTQVYSGVALNGGTGSGATANVTVNSTTVGGPINSKTDTLGNTVLATNLRNFQQLFSNVIPTGGNGNGATFDVIVEATASVGPIDSLGGVTGGADAAVGVYTNLPTTGGGGVGATVDVTVTAGPTFVATINNPGTGYNPDDFLTVAGTLIGGTANITIDIFQIDLPIAVTAINQTAAGTGYHPGDVLTFNPASIANVPGTSTTVDTINLTLEATNIALSNPGDLYSPADTLTIAAAAIGGVVGAGTSVSNINPLTYVDSLVLTNLGVNYTAGDILTANPGGVLGFNYTVSTVTLPTGVTIIGGVASGGSGYFVGDTITFAGINGSADFTATIASIDAGGVLNVTPYAAAAGVSNGYSATEMSETALIDRLTGVYFNVVTAGHAPDGNTVVAGDRIVSISNGGSSSWAIVPAASLGGDLSAYGQPCYQSQVMLTFTPEQTPPSNLWRFDAVTSSEIISDALRGIGFNGVPQAVEIEAGVNNVNRLYTDSQRYTNPFGFIAYYGPYVENGAGQFIPPSPYVTGVAVRRYRAEGYQFPPAGVKYQLADAVGAQIPINSAQQNLLNPDGCNAIRTLPGQPQTAVYIWGGRTRVNANDAQQKLYQFVNTRVILNVVYGSLRSAFDSQIFNVIDGFGVIYNQIISVGNSILNQLYVRGALYGAKPSDAFQVICDNRINSAEDLENGIVSAKVFVTPVPTLERIQIDLIRVALGKMQQELDVQGLGS